LTQTFTEVPHEFRKLTAQMVAVLLVDGKRALRRAENGERGRAGVNSRPAQLFKLCDQPGVAGKNRERCAKTFR
jgi:hypothetical protein